MDGPRRKTPLTMALLNAHAFSSSGHACGLARTSIASSVRFQIIRTPLRFFEDVLVEDVPLKSPKRILDRFAIVNSDFSHQRQPPLHLVAFLLCWPLVC